jgi:hypothetical protein
MSKGAGIIVIIGIILLIAVLLLVFHGIKVNIGAGQQTGGKNATFGDAITGFFNFLAGFKKGA